MGQSRQILENFLRHIYRVKRKKGRLVDRFSAELLRDISPLWSERGELWDVPLFGLFLSRPPPSPARSLGIIELALDQSDFVRSKSKSVIDSLLLLTLTVLPRDGQQRHTYTSRGLTDEQRYLVSADEAHLHAWTTDAAAAVAEAEERARSPPRSN